MSCIAILALTGVCSYLQQINNLDLVAATTYGRAFAIKLGLFGLLLLGGLNLFYLRRACAQAITWRARLGATCA